MSSVWLPIQFAAIALAALRRLEHAPALVRKRFDLVSATMGWPPYLRILVRAVIDNFGVLAFMLILSVIRTAIRAWATHPRTYILGVAVDLATAWLVITLAASLIRNPFINRLVSVTAWTIAALSILGLLDGTVAALDSRGDHDRRHPHHAAAGAQDRRRCCSVALWAATATGNFLDRRVQHVSGLTPSIQVLLGKLIRIGVMTAAIVIVLSAVRHRPVGAGGVHRRDRRRPRSRLAEDRLQFRQRHHPARRQVDQAGRRHHASATTSAGSPTWARATPRSI